MPFAKITFVLVNLTLVVITVIRIFLPIYFTYYDTIITTLNYDRQFEFTPFWMTVLVPWDLILAYSSIRSILKNDREQIFENAFRLSLFGLVIIWFINGLGERFESMAPVTLKRRIKQYDKNTRDRQVIDAIHTKFKCCGFSNLFVWKPETGMPSSCCKDGVCNGTNIYTVGCVGPLSDYIDSLNVWLLFTNFPFVELLVSLSSCLLTDYLPPPNIIYELGDLDDDNSPFSRTIPTAAQLQASEILRPRKLPTRTSELALQAVASTYSVVNVDSN
ncbi:uncharacterized protein LOC135841861 [Planococcus citri]|uniref:uncharacterized protein LOC135841861 n=1 Tax=Planococcus citri TaxID=170843 RepID=UPI0031F828FD